MPNYTKRLAGYVRNGAPPELGPETRSAIEAAWRRLSNTPLLADDWQALRELIFDAMVHAGSAANGPEIRPLALRLAKVARLAKQLDAELRADGDPQAAIAFDSIFPIEVFGPARLSLTLSMFIAALPAAEKSLALEMAATGSLVFHRPQDVFESLVADLANFVGARGAQATASRPPDHGAKPRASGFQELVLAVNAACPESVRRAFASEPALMDAVATALANRRLRDQSGSPEPGLSP